MGPNSPGGVWRRFLPPQPHRDAILEWLGRGRARLVHREAGQAPLVAFEDGGIIELDKVRCDERGQFERVTAAEVASSESGHRLTKYTDVCTSVDELQAALQREPRLRTAEREALVGLLDDAVYMIGRMYRREREYGAFAEGLSAICEEMRSTPTVDRGPADGAAAELRRVVSSARETGTSDLTRLNALAEQVRAVAQAQEDRLRAQKQAAIRVLARYLTLRGDRDWSAEEQDGGPPSE